MEIIPVKAHPLEGPSHKGLDKLTEFASKTYQDYEYPKVSIVVPCQNCAQSIGLTIESVLAQHYPDLELIIIDAGSTDRTLEIVRSYQNSKIHIYTVSQYQRYSMLNKGISQAEGVYVNFLFPGDFYLYPEVLKQIMNLALYEGQPPLIYSGSLLRDGKSEVKILYRYLSLDLLKRGQQPTSLQSMWFRVDLFKLLGKFNATYKMRGGYEFLCRFILHKELKAVSTSHVLTDYDLRSVTRKMVLLHFGETLLTLHKYFGIAASFKWLFFYQKESGRMVKLWYHSLQRSFLGK